MHVVTMSCAMQSMRRPFAPGGVLDSDCLGADGPNATECWVRGFKCLSDCKSGLTPAASAFVCACCVALPNLYRNTDTNETAWEIPTVDDSSSLSTLPHQQLQALGQQQHNHDQQQHLSQQQPQPEAMSQQELFDVLEAAYAADNSGMQFWEVARAHRHHGVFEPPFFEYLEARQAAAGSEEQRELAFKMMCRLSNPLLRQPAPFE